MAQSSAAREPTMEEILASIRRIIESNDAPQPEDIRPALSSVPGGLGDGNEVARMRAEPPAVTPYAEEDDHGPASELADDDAAPFVPPANDDISARQEAKPDEARPARAISLADVAARLRGTAQPSSPAAAAVQPAPPRATVPAPAEESCDMTADTREEAVSPIAPAQETRADLRAPRMAGLSLPLEPREAQRARETADAAPSMERGDFDSLADEAPRHDPAPQGNGGSALMSSATGAQVTAAFDGLSDVMRKGPMRSFDEIAEDMLRPMLRDWLDDNLPTLVERLVREEIERVARGGRR